jgi:hypothetical protein
VSGPLPKYRVVVAFDRHRVDDVIEPTGLMRDRLLRLGFVALVEPEQPVRAFVPQRITRRGVPHA